MRNIRIAVIAGLVALAAPAVAQARGTHFIIEAGAGVSDAEGYTFDDTLGTSIGVTLGAGGKFSGNPLRLYVIGNLMYSGFDMAEVKSVWGGTLQTSGRMSGFFLGGRALLPVYSGLRIYGEFGLGSTHTGATLTDSEQIIDLGESESNFSVIASTGIEYRLLRSFSLGAKANVVMIDDTPQNGPFNSLVPAKPGSWASLKNFLLTATIHF